MGTVSPSLASLVTNNSIDSLANSTFLLPSEAEILVRPILVVPTLASSLTCRWILNNSLGIFPDLLRIPNLLFSALYKTLKDSKIYDCILIGNELENINNPINFLKRINKHLIKDGVVIGEIHNTSSIHTINYLLNDISYDLFKNQKNLLTLNDLKNILIKSGFYNIEIYSWYDNKNKEEEKLLNIFNKEHLKYSYYTFKAKKKEK